jgi:hypothetical protein
MTIAVRGGSVIVVTFHSGEYGEHTREILAAFCRSAGVTQSMERIDSALGNAVATSFNSMLQLQSIGDNEFHRREEARRAVVACIDDYQPQKYHTRPGPGGMNSIGGGCAARSPPRRARLAAGPPLGLEGSVPRSLRGACGPSCSDLSSPSPAGAYHAGSDRSGEETNVSKVGRYLALTHRTWCLPRGASTQV